MKKDINLAEMNIKVPADRNTLLQKVIKNVNESDEIKALWIVMNVNASERLKMSDHGYVHFQIVSNIALKLARMLNKNNVKLSVQTDYELSYEYGELVILLGSLFHDLGITVDRKGHEEFSVSIANVLMRELLQFLPIVERTIIISETLHSIISHRDGGKPLTIEAGIVRVADALDMTEGRSKDTFQKGGVDIYNLSELAIDDVSIVEGTSKPIQINITMNNSAGLFRVDELLKKKIHGSGLEEYIGVTAKVHSKKEKKLLEEFSF